MILHMSISSSGCWIYMCFFQNNQKAWNAGEKRMRKVLVVGSDQTNKIYSKSLLSALT